MIPTSKRLNTMCANIPLFVVRLHSAAGVVARRAKKMPNFKAVFNSYVLN